MKFLKKIDKKFLLWSVLILILFGLSRFLYLGARAAHHDEGMLAYFAYQLASSGDYTYTPQIHGPILFYLTALVFKIFHTLEAIRVSTAVCGVILGLSAFLYFKKESKVTAIAIALVFLTSPFLTYYSRFLVHTAIVILFHFCFVLSIRNFFRYLKPLDLFASALFLALAFGTSETSYIFVAIFVLFVPVYFLLNRVSFLEKWTKLRKFLRQNIFDVFSAILVFAIAWLLIYSVGLLNLESLRISLPNPFSEDYGLGFWLKQHPVKLGGQPWFYYLMLSFVYELISLFAFLFFLPDVIKKRRPFELFLAWWTIASFIGFSWAGEKFPWLFLPSLLPLAFAAGYFISKRISDLGLTLKIILLVLFLWTSFVCVRLNFFYHNDTRELPVYVQTPKEFEAIEKEMLSKCEGLQTDCILIDPKITWPLSWDLYGSSRLEEFGGDYNVPDGTKYVLMSFETNLPKVFENGWNKKPVQLRDWWVPLKCREVECIPDYIKYFFSRAIWNEKGGFNINLIEKE